MAGIKAHRQIILLELGKEKCNLKSGAFAEVKDLEFMYVFNAGGTMIESSNYDGTPPVPSAYGIWKKTGDKKVTNIKSS